MNIFMARLHADYGASGKYGKLHEKYTIMQVYDWSQWIWLQICWTRKEKLIPVIPGLDGVISLKLRICVNAIEFMLHCKMLE